MLLLTLLAATQSADAEFDNPPEFIVDGIAYGESYITEPGKGKTSVWAKDNEAALNNFEYWGLGTDPKPTYLDLSGEVVIPEHVSYNGVDYEVYTFSDYAFSYCYGIESISLPNTLLGLRQSCFEGCTGLTSITLPNSAVYFGDKNFYKCFNLKKVIINSSYLERFDKNEFVDCPNIEFLSINPQACADITYFEYSRNALKTLALRDSVAWVDENAFENCTSLNTLLLGENIGEIKDNAFNGCTALKDVVALKEQPVAINENVFGGLTRENCKLHVKKGSKEYYADTEVWKDFMITEDADEFAKDVIGENSEDPAPEGDLNRDGSVNTGDVSELYKAVLAGNADGLYDLNDDGSVNTGDVSALYRIILGN